MIIVDFSGVLVANVHSLVKMNGDFEKSLYKHLVLNSVLSFKKKFSKEYGNLVFAMDSKPYWRTESFPHYKMKRGDARRTQQAKNDHVDWDHVFDVMNELTDELQTVFPYKVIKIPTCEADDIIGVLCKDLNEKIMIISRDGDFKQLQRYPNVKQWEPVGKKLVKEPHPLKYLKEHIIRGDSGDGIPNILSADDSFFSGTKQKSVFAKDVKIWINKDVRDFAETTDILDRFYQNESLIDLSKVPDDLQKQIMEEYYKPQEGHNKNIHSYLIKNRLSNLMGEIQFFLEKQEDKPTLASLI